VGTCYFSSSQEAALGELKVRQLDDHIIEALKARAAAKEEEVRTTLSDSVAAKHAAMGRRFEALQRAAGGKPGRPDSSAHGSSAKSGMPGVDDLRG
jgi:plasmid stability protein